MPSTVVHVAVGGLLATSLLAEHFDGRAALVVMGAAALPDLDTLLGWWIPGGHRAILHTLLLPIAVGALLSTDAVGSRIRRRWGEQGVRVAWVALVSLLVAGIAPDLFTNGVNSFYPLYDQFYSISGRLSLSNERGVVQTFFEANARGTTETTHYRTGFDIARGSDPVDRERVFPVVTSGKQLLLVLTSAFVVGFRLRESRKK